jgi:uncharacterized protein
VSDTTIQYDQLVDQALKSVIKNVLSEVAKTGLPGDHHFYISFKTKYPGVSMPDYLRDEYPDDITIVLQHQFFGLKVFEKSFEVMLTFKSVPEKVAVPYDAITDFVDPDSRFRLQFDAQLPNTPEVINPDNVEDPDGDDSGGSKVLSIDSFRKKK